MMRSAAMRHGHTLILVMLVLAASLSAGAIFTSRLVMNIKARRATAVRHQALWLGRSAVETGFAGSRLVETRLGTARVEARREGGVRVVVVELEGATATVTSTPYGERFVGGGG